MSVILGNQELRKRWAPYIPGAQELSDQKEVSQKESPRPRQGIHPNFLCTKNRSMHLKLILGGPEHTSSVLAYSSWPPRARHSHPPTVLGRPEHHVFAYDLPTARCLGLGFFELPDITLGNSLVSPCLQDHSLSHNPHSRLSRRTAGCTQTL